jgi:hypothetical protein
MLAPENFHGSRVWHKPGLSGPSGESYATKQTSRPNRPHEQDRLADFSSIPLERMYLTMVLGKVIVLERIARSLTGCHPVPIMFLSPMSLLRQGVIACRLHLRSHRTSRKNVSMDSVNG